jgi:hypothetical protein
MLLSVGLSGESVACGVEVVLALLRAEEIADFTNGAARAFDGPDGARVTIGRHARHALELVRIQHLRSAWIGDWRAGVDRGCENSARESIEPRRARIFAIYLALRGYRPRKLGARDPPLRGAQPRPLAHV